MASQENLFIGIRGCVLAIDRTTGKEVWTTSLKGADFVNVVPVSYTHLVDTANLRHVREPADLHALDSIVADRCV